MHFNLRNKLINIRKMPIPKLTLMTVDNCFNLILDYIKKNEIIISEYDDISELILRMIREGYCINFDKNLFATGLFILAGISDWLDGYLARKLQLESKFGAFIDPVADKLIVIASLVLLVELDLQAQKVSLKNQMLLAA